MAWKKLDTQTLSGTADDIDITGLTENKFMTILNQTVPTGNVQITQYTGTGSFVTTGGEYSQRNSVNAAADGTRINSNDIEIGSSINAVYTAPRFSIIHCINIATQDKLMIAHVVNANNSGAGTAPDREECFVKWENNTTVMDQWRSHNIETGDQTTDTNLTGFGTD
tara:strand:+ start:742 stop:1242 length:501 start_codon:yes stop_codon:yes gene_type:complete